MISPLVTAQMWAFWGFETLELQANGRHTGFERFFDSASQNQILEKNIANKIRRALDIAISTADNLMHDAILKAMYK